MYILSLSFSLRSQVHDLVPQHKKLLSWKQLRMPTWQQLTFKPGGTPCLLPSPPNQCISAGAKSAVLLPCQGRDTLCCEDEVQLAPTPHVTYCTPKLPWENSIW